MAKLSERQEAYCQNIMTGMSRREAYKSAYPKAQKWKGETIDSNAIRLESNPRVVARLDTLRKEQAERLAISRDGILRDLEAFRNSIDLSTATARDWIEIVKLEVKILGYDRGQGVEKDKAKNSVDLLAEKLFKKVEGKQ